MEEEHILNTDILKSYYQEIKKYPILSKEEQKQLAIKYQNGDEEARQKLINSNLRFVVKVANQFKSVLKSMEVLDIIQEGNLGLMRAIETYDPLQGAFTTYSYNWIYQFIDRAIKNKNNEIRTPVHFQEIKNKYLKLINKYEGQTLPSDKEICDILNIDIKILNQIRESNIFNTDSLNKTVGDEEKSELQDFVGYTDSDAENVEKNIDNHLFLLTLKNNLSSLHYYVLYNTVLIEDKKSLRTLGKEFALSYERIRQIQSKALQKSKRIIENRSRYTNYKIDTNMKENIYPIEPNSVVMYTYLKENISDIEKNILYLNLIENKKYDEKEYSDLLGISIDELAKIKINLDKYIKEKLKNKNAYIHFKKNLITMHQGSIFKLLNDETPTIDYYAIKEKYDTYSYEDLLESFKSYIEFLPKKDQELLKQYFKKTEKQEIKKDYLERKFNLAVNQIKTNSTDLKHDILYKTLKENTESFTEEQILYLECFYFQTKEKKEFKEKFPDSYLRGSYPLIQRLEQLYFNINRMLENNFNPEKYIKVRDNLTLENQLYLDYFYGFNKPLKTIKEMSVLFKEDYIKTHDKVRSAREKAINIYTNRSGSLKIDKTKYIEYITNKSYEWEEETKTILELFFIKDLTYDEISKITNLSNYKISNIITDAIRRMDFYRYKINEVYIISESDFNNIINSQNYTDEEKNILRERFIMFNSIDKISSQLNISNVTINRLVTGFIKHYYKYLTKDVELTNDDYYKVFNMHWTESPLNEEEKEIIALYCGIKCSYNKSGIELSAKEIGVKFNKTRNVVYHTALRCLERIKLFKINKYHKDLCYINRNELNELLDDPFLPISKKEKTIICHLFALKNHEYKNLKEIGKLFDISESSTKRRYQRAILNILKYKSKEIKGIITHESILPYLKYFSNSDKKFIEEYYKNNLTYEAISTKYNISRDKTINIFNRIKPFLYDLINNQKVSKFDFDYYELVKFNKDLPFYGNREEALKIFDLFFGQNEMPRKTIPEIKKELNLEISPSGIQKIIVNVLISIEKYKIGIKKQIIFNYDYILNYFLRNKDKMSAAHLKIYKKYFDKISNHKFMNSKYQYPSEEIILDLLKEENNYVRLNNITKEEMIHILKDSKIKMSKKLKSMLISFYEIDDRQLMSGKDKQKIYKILHRFEKSKEHITERQKTYTKKEQKN